MIKHRFLFEPARWVGGGKITFEETSGLVRFYSSWVFESSSDKKIHCHQRIELQELGETMNNFLTIYDICENRFKIELKSDLIKESHGKGIIDNHSIAWEFHGTEGVEGFEIYTLQSDDDYTLHAEYSSSELFRSKIDARLWKKDSLA